MLKCGSRTFAAAAAAPPAPVTYLKSVSKSFSLIRAEAEEDDDDDEPGIRSHLAVISNFKQNITLGKSDVNKNIKEK